MPEPCKIHWCDALATREEYCAVHYSHPDYDPRKEYERQIDTNDGRPTVDPLRAPVRRRSKRVPVDERPLIVAAKE